MDLTTLELQNCCERDLEDWAASFVQADAQFQFLGAKHPTGSKLWIMEAIWEEEELGN